MGGQGDAADRFGAFVAIVANAPAGAGPLSGLRVAVKDNIAVAGLPFTAGHPLFADRIAATDASAVRRLRERGARIVGVTAPTPEASASPPPRSNPAAPGCTVGGSSGGSAAAVAAGLADVALGTDTGGSVRIPAACTGLIGFKPTRGQIATDGVWPLSPSLDHIGIIGRDLDIVAQTAECLLTPSPAAPPVSQRPLRLGSIAGCWPHATKPSRRHSRKSLARCETPARGCAGRATEPGGRARCPSRDPAGRGA